MSTRHGLCYAPVLKKKVDTHRYIYFDIMTKTLACAPWSHIHSSTSCTVFLQLYDVPCFNHHDENNISSLKMIHYKTRSKNPISIVGDYSQADQVTTNYFQFKKENRCKTIAFQPEINRSSRKWQLFKVALKLKRTPFLMITIKKVFVLRINLLNLFAVFFWWSDLRWAVIFRLFGRQCWWLPRQSW